LSWPRGVASTRAAGLRTPPTKVTELRAKAAAGVPKTELARQHGIHRDTVYRYLTEGE
jgi:DNA invertase Pin-like site-specific DNA recombinase